MWVDTVLRPGSDVECVQGKHNAPSSSNAFAAEEDSRRSWTEHFLYLVTLARKNGLNEQFIVENIVKYAAPKLQLALLARYNPHRQDYLQHA